MNLPSRDTPPAPAGFTRFASVLAALLLAQHVGQKAVRDALFLTHEPATMLPSAMVLSAVVSIVVAVGAGRLLRKADPGRLLAGLCGAQAGLFGLGALTLTLAPVLTAWFTYLHVAALGALAVSVFWLQITERLSFGDAKRAVAPIGAGAAFGGLVGGVVATFAANQLGPRGLLAGLAVSGVVASVLAWRFVGNAPTQGAPLEEEEAPAREASRYLRHIGVVVALLATVGALLDFGLKSMAQASFGAPDAAISLFSFFAAYHTACGVAAFAVQGGLTGRLLRDERGGVRAALATLPLVGALGGLGLFAAMTTAAAVAARGAFTVATNSVYRSSYELLYAPLPTRSRRVNKPLIDIAVERFGDAAGGALVLGLVIALPGSPVRAAALLAVGFAVACLVAVVRLERRYLRAMLDTLRARAEVEPAE